MKKFDYKLAKEIILANQDSLESASLGMHEDWFWTAEDIWKDGVFTHPLPANINEIEAEYISKRKEGMSLFSEEIREYNKNFIGGILGSSWATPTIQLSFKNGTEKMLPCYQGFSDEKKPENWAKEYLGCLSKEVQENITPLTVEPSRKTIQ